VSKDALFKKEKESARRTARCHVSLEKSSKNYIHYESEPSQAAIHSVPPYLPAKKRVLRADFPSGEGKCASWRRSSNSPWRLGTWRGEGGVICGLISFDNGSSVLRPFQHEDGQWCSAPFLFGQDLPNSYWWPTASFVRLYKGPRMAIHPQSTKLHSTGNISVWTKEVGHSNTCGTVRLCSFQLKFTAAL
jgi:hypothetical protein